MKSLWFLPIFWVVGTTWLYLVTTFFVPDSRASQSLKEELSFPSSLDELKLITTTLLEFQTSHPFYVLILFISAYLYKQTFAIPGSVFMNILSGALYGTVKGTCLCCVLTATGASMCYLLSSISGSDVVINFWPDRINQLRAQVEVNRERLPYFLISLRLVPVSPNWFINITSPILGIPLNIFALTAFLGLIPYNFMCVKAGSVISELVSVNDMFNFQTISSLILMALVASIPGFLHKKLQKMS